MNRRRFLTAIGAGSIGTGALVGTSGFSRVQSQRRVKLEVGPRDDRAGISFVAFCAPDEDGLTDEDVTRVEATEFKQDGDPIALEWESDVGIQSVVLFGGNEFFNFPEVNDTSGEVEMGERGTGEPGPGEPEGPPEDPGQSDGQHPSTPRAFEEGTCGIKYEPPDDPETEEFEFDDSTC